MYNETKERNIHLNRLSNPLYKKYNNCLKPKRKILSLFEIKIKTSDKIVSKY